MLDTKDRIARDLHSAFSELGFATQGVEALRAQADISIRTLYKHFPSREAMIVGALEHRDQAYLNWISGGPDTGTAHVLHPLVRLGDWLRDVANTGCLFWNALAEYPDSAEIAAAVRHHKAKVAKEFQERLHRVAPRQPTDALADALFVLHEGMTDAARLRGPRLAESAALDAAQIILKSRGIE